MRTCYLVLRSRGSLPPEQELLRQTPAGGAAARGTGAAAWRTCSCLLGNPFLAQTHSESRSAHQMERNPSISYSIPQQGRICGSKHRQARWQHLSKGG